MYLAPERVAPEPETIAVGTGHHENCGVLPPLPPKNTQKHKHKHARSGSMVSMQIIQFKCVVNVYDQDFGTFCRERGLKEKKRFGEQQGATKPPPGFALGGLVEQPCQVAGFGCLGLAMLAIADVCWWLWALRSLLGWLWWLWDVLLGSN